jgi:hypothetical protein
VEADAELKTKANNSERRTVMATSAPKSRCQR